MSDDTIINQNWYHIYDKVDLFSNSKKIRQVYDFYTVCDYFIFEIKDNEFANLDIKGRNVNSELGYIENNGEIRISLGPMERWPDAPTNVCTQKDGKIKEYKHVKIDIGYTLTNPFLKKIGFFLRVMNQQLLLIKI